MIEFHIIRHGNAVALMDDGLDRDRPLSVRGLDQADKLCAWYRGNRVPIAAAFHSPAVRAEATCRLAVAHQQEIEPVCLDCLFTGREDEPDKTIDAAFEKYGYDLTPYMIDPAVRNALRQYAGNAAEVIWGEIKRRSLQEGVVLIACHAVIANWIALYLTDCETAQFEELTGEWMLSETDRLVVRGTTVEFVKAS